MNGLQCLAIVLSIVGLNGALFSITFKLRDIELILSKMERETNDEQEKGE